MEQLHSTVAVLSDDLALHERVHGLFSHVELPELYCLEHQDIALSRHTTAELIVLAIPRAQMHELAAVLDTLAHDQALAHLPVLVYVPEAHGDDLLKTDAVDGARASPGEAALAPSAGSLDDGLPCGREDL
jgi:hypothetical protein